MEQKHSHLESSMEQKHGGKNKTSQHGSDFDTSGQVLGLEEKTKIKESEDKIPEDKYRKSFEYFKMAMKKTTQLQSYAKAGGVNNVKLPMIVCTGVTSAGKSSITARVIPVPVAFSQANAATRCPVMYILILSDQPTKVKVGDVQCERDWKKASNLIKKHMEDLGDEFSDEPLSVEIKGKDIEFETVWCDLPGLVTDTKHRQPVDDITKKYINDENSIVIIINEATDEMSNLNSIHRVMELASNEDELASRTVTIINKFDLRTDRVERAKNETTDELNIYLQELKETMDEKGIFTCLACFNPPGDESDQEWNLLKPKKLHELSAKEALLRRKKATYYEEKFFQEKMKSYSSLANAWNKNFGFKPIVDALAKIFFEKLEPQLPTVEDHLQEELGAIISSLRSMEEKFTLDSAPKMKEKAIDYITCFCRNIIICTEGGEKAKAKNKLKNSGFTFAEEWKRFQEYTPDSKKMWKRANGLLTPRQLEAEFRRRGPKYDFLRQKMGYRLLGMAQLTRLFEMFEAMIYFHKYRPVSNESIIQYWDQNINNTNKMVDIQRAIRHCAVGRVRGTLGAGEPQDWAKRKVDLKAEGLIYEPAIDFRPPHLNSATRLGRKSARPFRRLTEKERDERAKEIVDQQLAGSKIGRHANNVIAAYKRTVEDGAHAIVFLMHCVQAIIHMIRERTEKQTLAEMPVLKKFPRLRCFVADRFKLEIRKILGEATQHLHQYLYYVTETVDPLFHVQQQKMLDLLYPNRKSRTENVGNLFKICGRLLISSKIDSLANLGLQFIHEVLQGSGTLEKEVQTLGENTENRKSTKGLFQKFLHGLGKYHFRNLTGEAIKIIESFITGGQSRGEDEVPSSLGPRDAVCSRDDLPVHAEDTNAENTSDSKSNAVAEGLSENPASDIPQLLSQLDGIMSKIMAQEECPDVSADKIAGGRDKVGTLDMGSLLLRGHRHADAIVGYHTEEKEKLFAEINAQAEKRYWALVVHFIPAIHDSFRTHVKGRLVGADRSSADFLRDNMTQAFSGLCEEKSEFLENLFEEAEIQRQEIADLKAKALELNKSILMIEELKYDIERFGDYIKLDEHDWDQYDNKINDGVAWDFN